jgi:hypothetical protein
MKDNSKFEDMIKKDLDVHASDRTYNRMRQIVLDAHEQSKQKPSAARLTITRRTIMKSPITKVATAAVIIVLLMLWINYLNAPIDGASTLYAAAMDRVKEARTFSCVGIFEVTYEGDGKRGKYLMKQKWMFKEPDRERHEKLTSAPPWPQYKGEVTIWHYGKRQQLRLRPLDKTAIFHDMSSDYEIDGKTGELKLIQLDTNLRDRLLKLSAGAVDDLGRVELDGRSVRMLRSRRNKRITTVWVNPETGYPIRIEHKWTDQSRSPVVYTSIQIDTELDDSLFNLDPPTGYTLRVDKSSWPGDKAKIGAKIMHLGKLCLIYANKHNNQFPDKLADLVNADIITDEVLNRVLAGPDGPNGPPVIGFRKPDMDADWSTEVMLFEIFHQWPKDGVVACFTDGHSELIGDQKRFEELMR